jgi:heme oxygenase-like protein
VSAGPFLDRPRLRDGVALARSGSSVTLDYRDQGCTIEFSPETGPTVSAALDALRGEVPWETVLASHRELQGHIHQLLEDLDRLGLLTSAGSPEGDAIPGTSGLELYRRVRAQAAGWISRASPPFYARLQAGEVTRAQLVGYALEYYHLVRATPGLIAPVLGHAHRPRTRWLLERFVRSELGHHEMLAEALAAAGVDPGVLDRVVPLPETFALCAQLGVLAAQDPLSFQCVLFLFEEENPAFHDAFVKACGVRGLGEAFHGPIVRHALINSEGAHGDISRELMAEVPWVSREEELVVLKQVATAVETLVGMEHRLLRHYGGPEDSMLRVG